MILTFDELAEYVEPKTYSCVSRSCGCTDCTNCCPNQTETEEEQE